MNNEMTRQEMIDELDRIAVLNGERRSLMLEKYTLSSETLSSEIEVEDYDQVNESTENLDLFGKEQFEKLNKKKPVIAPDCFVIPPDPPIMPKSLNPEKDILIGAGSGLLMMFSLALWLFLRLLDLGNSALGLVFLSIFLMLGSVAFWFAKGSFMVSVFFDWEKAQKEWEEKQKQWEDNFNRAASKEENERFLREFKEYDDCFFKLVNACSQKQDEEHRRCEKAREKKKEKYFKMLAEIEEKIAGVEEKIAGVNEQLDKVTLIDADLFGIAWRISYMLSIGRAETLTEAINLAFDEERKDNEEAARQEEARRQEAILEQQARDNRMHNAAMQRAAEEEARSVRAHNIEMEKAARAQAQAAQAQAREAAKQSELAKKQAQEARNAAISRCARCVNNTKCSYKVKQNAINCPGFRPR